MHMSAHKDVILMALKSEVKWCERKSIQPISISSLSLQLFGAPLLN